MVVDCLQFGAVFGRVPIKDLKNTDDFSRLFHDFQYSLGYSWMEGF